MTVRLPIAVRVVLPLLPLCLLTGSPALAQGVLLVHDAGPAPAPDEQEAIAWTRDLLGHFDVDVTVTDVHSYRPGGTDDHDSTVYLGLRPGLALPEGFLADCARTTAPFCWIGANVEQLLALAAGKSFGFTVQAGSADLRPGKVTYKGSAYWRDEVPLPLIAVTAAEACQPIALVEAGGERHPYAVRAGEFWYFAELPVRLARMPGVYLIPCDQMHEFLQEPHDLQRTALLLIRGVTPATDAGRLALLVRQLQAEGVPFAIEVAATQQSADSDRRVRLEQRRGLVSVLRGAQRTGASIVGCLPGPDPQSAASVTVSKYFNDTLDELARCGLYPVAWSVARRAYGDREASALGKLCSTLFDRAGDRPTVAPMPFLVERSDQGQRVMPDNLQALTRGGGEVEAMLEAARRQAIVPDPCLTVGVAVGAPAAAVSLLVDGLHESEFGFRDLRFDANTTSGESLQVSTVASQHKLAELVAREWSATILGPEPGAKLTVERASRRFSDAVVHPGAIVVSYRNREPKVILSFEGDAQQVTERGVHGIARLIVIIAMAAGGVLFLIYLAQLVQRRGA